MNTAINICGFGNSSGSFWQGLKAGEFADQEIWAINNVFDERRSGDKPTMIFALDDLQRDEKEYPDYVDGIVNAGVPVITCTAYSKWPATVAYPIKEVALDFMGLPLGLAQRVFSNTWCYAFAYALWKISREPNDPSGTIIRLWGADFVQSDMADPFGVARAQRKLKRHHPFWFLYYQESMIRKPLEPGLDGLTFLLGWAEAMGYNVFIPSDCPLLNLDRPGFFYGHQVQPDVPDVA